MYSLLARGTNLYISQNQFHSRMSKADFFAKVEDTRNPFTDLHQRHRTHKHEHDSSSELEIIVSKFDFTIWLNDWVAATNVVCDFDYKWVVDTSFGSRCDCNRQERNICIGTNEWMHAYILIEFVTDLLIICIECGHVMNRKPIGFACKWHFALKWLCLGLVSEPFKGSLHTEPFKVHFCMQISTPTAHSIQRCTHFQAQCRTFPFHRM